MLHLLLAALSTTCGVSSRPAALVSPPVLTLPADAHFTGVKRAVLRLRIDAGGSVVSAAIVRGSGIATLDRQALTDAKTAKFSPAISHCKAVARSYDFTVNFDSTQTAPERAGGPGSKCPVPDREAKMEHLQPPSINDNDTGDGAVTLDMIIDKDGDVASYTVAKSSGSVGMDNQVITAAKQSKYLPKLVNCAPVDGGHYIFRFKL